jgi:agmatinase
MSFFRLPPELSQSQTARFQIVPVPYEGTVCFMPGTAKGPGAILDVSDQVEHFDEELLFDISKEGIATHPAIPPADTPAQEFERIYETVKQYKFFPAGKFPIFLGGEHSITPPIVKNAVETFGNGLSVLQFDAHGDLRDTYTGGKYSHGCAMRRVLDFTSHLVQVGIRSFSEEEYRAFPDRIKGFLTPTLLAENFAGCLDQILSRLTDRVYITFDIDAFDSSIVPGTGTPEPGGLDWRTATAILKAVCRAKHVVGADVVEVAPLGGGNVISEFLAARLVGKIIAYATRV